MENSEFEPVIIEAINFSADETGWANLAKIGFQLNKNGVDIKSLGYKKLSHFLKDYSNILEIKVDQSINPPIAYARVKQHA
jgi:hypothetical protein